MRLWGVSFKEAQEAALANLRSEAGHVRIWRVAGPPDYPFEHWAASLDSMNHHTASLVLLDELVEQIPIPRSEQIIVLPSRRVLAFIRNRGRALRYAATLSRNLYRTSCDPVAPFPMVWMASGPRRAPVR